MNKYYLMFFLVLLNGCIPSYNCPHATIPKPGTDKTPPLISASIKTYTNGDKILANNDIVYLYPGLNEDFLITVSAEDAGGIKDLRLTYNKTTFSGQIGQTQYDSVAQEVVGDEKNPCEKSFLFYPIKEIKKNESYAYTINAEDYSGNFSSLNVVLERADIESELFNYSKPGTIVTIEGVLTDLSYNPYDPDYHYNVIVDNQYANLADTIGTDALDVAGIYIDGVYKPSGGQFHPEQDGFLSNCALAKNTGLNEKSYGNCDNYPNGIIPPPKGWVTWDQSPGVYWPWLPNHDCYGRELKPGDHIRMRGRLYYDHVGDENVQCFNTGVTQEQFEKHFQGHAEIHPIDYIELLDQLPSNAETDIWLNACASNGLLSGSSTTKDLYIKPAAPRPANSNVSVEETIDGAFTTFRTIKEHTITPYPSGEAAIVHIKVEGESAWGAIGKFRAKYRLWWSPAGSETITQK